MVIFTINYHVQLRVMDELFQNAKAMEMESARRSISSSDFKEILRKRKPSVSVNMMKAYAHWTKQFKAL